ncbi:MAG: WecB/TagA/CpsF family glycosyltransferase [Spirulinaceae cyanobacterium RM2_2_10]|nr:WecB/TagA/CpsF family glycosyltransferase [Spirulinaceae cyanobacterium SM2_1_0]NJO20706.1 WecB/TagA/CpsF family glycosyltransferase [Spirulinaceae cyanobacterium RM2_2_10]
MLEAPRRSQVFNLPIDLSDDYVSWVRSLWQQNRGAHVVTLNSEMVMQAERDPQLAATIQQAELVIPDGAGVVFYLRLRQQHQQRCPGIELASALLAAAAQLNLHEPIAFYGGAPGVAEQAARSWQAQFPSLRLLTFHGYLNPEATEALQQTFKAEQPRLIFVGLGVPRQEFWIAQHRHLCPQAIWIGVGGSFDIWAGVKTRAPVWWCEHNLEWLYRLYQEPWRWRRMLVLPQFALRALVSTHTPNRYSAGDPPA